MSKPPGPPESGFGAAARPARGARGERLHGTGRAAPVEGARPLPGRRPGRARRPFPIRRALARSRVRTDEGRRSKESTADMLLKGDTEPRSDRGPGIKGWPESERPA